MSLQDYEILEELGKGAYSIVFKVRRLKDGKIYALKQVKISNLKEKEKRNALNEVRFLASIKNPNVISYKQAFFDENENLLCLVMEYADGGDLLQRIQSYQKKGTYMSENFIWSLVSQLASGLKALHDLDIVHRDLKSANVFLMKDGRAKLGDMNVSKISKQCLEHTQTGTPYYASPEVWQDLPYDCKSDLWSLGCVIYECSCLKPPFRADDLQGLFKKVVKGEYPSLPRSFSSDLNLLISRLLMIDPQQRIGPSSILTLPEVKKRLVNDEDSQSSLLQTIYFPTKVKQLADCLPRANFDSEEPHLKNGKSLNLPTMKKSSKVREVSESFIKEVKEEGKREKSLDNLGRYRKIILKENFGALRLPRVKYHSKVMKSLAQAGPKESTIGPRVNSEKIKPSTNRSMIVKRINI
jgi:NIMA (never in mitosis gene a)-related kinase